MPGSESNTVIKKYANRRLYNTGTSSYVTLDDLATMVKKGEDFTVRDAKTGDDITHMVLTQIIFDQECRSGQALLPVSFLRELISYYGDQMQAMLPGFLDHAMKAFSEQQQHMRDQMDRALYENPLKRHLYQSESDERPIGRYQPLVASARRETEDANGKAETTHALDDLKKQLQVLQERLENM
ncbi:polyhydroxyalkanoate synthesis repressor PhaR [Martelella alba]|uniref:Polyhydroxyalkanoate synthesis repressor PhaR n=1 Tax=Martelella alba TaxID=2590451 RepID=A0A506UDM3_9HYPH|nr:polyhydroxyalkanoate synthesis repressor PhaR [Martelella alba]TPW32533.1 polyhydroxyalkanoate synthesis repressor PhaR [Martelella alba]